MLTTKLPPLDACSSMVNIAFYRRILFVVVITQSNDSCTHLLLPESQLQLMLVSIIKKCKKKYFNVLANIL